MRLFERLFRFGIGDRFVGPMFRRLFLPSLLFSTGWALSDIADAVVVGQRLGTVGLAGIALVLPVYMINCTLAHGLGLGGSVRFSRLMAHGDFAAARDCFGQTILSALALSGATAVFGLCGMDLLLAALGASQASPEVHPGDTLFVYTDGVPEAVNADQAFYGGERLVEVLNRLADRSLGEILHGIKDDIDVFTGSVPQFDDITMMALTYNGPA